MRHWPSSPSGSRNGAALLRPLPARSCSPPQPHYLASLRPLARPSKKRSMIHEWRSGRFRHIACTYDAPSWGVLYDAPDGSGGGGASYVQAGWRNREHHPNSAYSTLPVFCGAELGHTYGMCSAVVKAQGSAIRTVHAAAVVKAQSSVRNLAVTRPAASVVILVARPVNRTAERLLFLFRVCVCVCGVCAWGVWVQWHLRPEQCGF